MTSLRYTNRYPDGLNPFGSDDEDEDEQNVKALTSIDEYPDYLSPFGEDSDDDNKEEKDDGNENINKTNQNELSTSISNHKIEGDYDKSLNPFGDDDDEGDVNNAQASLTNNTAQSGEKSSQKDASSDCSIKINGTKLEVDVQSNNLSEISLNDDDKLSDPKATEVTNGSLLIPDDKPPIPLPRTKSLLKKGLLKKASPVTGYIPDSIVSRSQSTTAISTTANSQSTPTFSPSTGASTMTRINVRPNMPRKKRPAPPIPTKSTITSTNSDRDKEDEAVTQRESVENPENN